MNFELLEGRIFGARYYTASPVLDWDKGSSWYSQQWDEMMAWCVETYGPTPENGIWTTGELWYANNAKFWFRNEQDRTTFLLRWS